MPQAAASALTPIAGRFASTLFAIGFIGSGILPIPVLAGAGAAGMSGLFHKEWSFSRSIRKAPVFCGLVAFGTVGGADGAEDRPQFLRPTGQRQSRSMGTTPEAGISHSASSCGPTATK